MATKISDQKLLASIAKRASLDDQLAIVEAEALQNLTPAYCNRVLTDARIEVLLLNVAAGGIIREICRKMQIAAGLVYQRAYDDPEGFGARLRMAKEIGAHSLYQRMYEVAWNEAEDVRSRKLKCDVLEKFAKAYNRDSYSEHIRHDIRQAVAYIMPKDTDDLC